MSHNPGDAATTAREQETEQTQTPSAEPAAQGAQASTSAQPTANAATATSETSAASAQSTGAPHPAEGNQSFGTQQSDNPQASGTETRAESAHASAAGTPQPDNPDQPAQSAQSGASQAPTASAPSSEAQASTPVQSAASATPQPTGEPDEGVAGSANVDALTPAQQATKEEFAPRPDVSNQDWQQLVPKLLALFNNNREQLGRALGLHRSTVDRWLNGKSRPNTSTILRMRRLAQERNVE